MPTARRSYATALLESRVYTCTPAPGATSVALGSSHSRKKRFARRLTMVMTHQVTPRRTLTGLALAGTVLTAGWLVSPAFACPPEKKAKADAVVVTTTKSSKTKTHDRCVRSGRAPMQLRGGVRRRSARSESRRGERRKHLRTLHARTRSEPRRPDALRRRRRSTQLFDDASINHVLAAIDLDGLDGLVTIDGFEDLSAITSRCSDDEGHPILLSALNGLSGRRSVHPDRLDRAARHASATRCRTASGRR